MLGVWVIMDWQRNSHHLSLCTVTPEPWGTIIFIRHLRWEIAGSSFQSLAYQSWTNQKKYIFIYICNIHSSMIIILNINSQSTSGQERGWSPCRGPFMYTGTLNPCLRPPPIPHHHCTTWSTPANIAVLWRHLWYPPWCLASPWSA